MNGFPSYLSPEPYYIAPDIPSLIKAPEDVIDYIVLHELCHLKIKEHSCYYWDLLYKFMPNYHEKIEWLRVNGGSLLIAM